MGLRLEVGLIDADTCTHVITPRLNGLHALCGRGRIVKRVPCAADPTDEVSCEACVIAMSANRVSA